MTNRIGAKIQSDYVFIEGKIERPETFSAAVAGTAATITDTTSYAVADQVGKTSIVTLVGDSDYTGAQTVTFGTATTALEIAADYNAQAKGLSADVVGGQVKLTSDKTGSGMSISVAAGTGALTWAAPVAGTGSPAGVVVTPGTLLARTTATTGPYTAGDVVVYDSTNTPAGANAIKGVADFDLTIAASGSKAIKMAVAGKVVEGQLSKHDGAAITAIELDQLIANTDVVPVPVSDINDYQNA